MNTFRTALPTVLTVIALLPGAALAQQLFDFMEPEAPARVEAASTSGTGNIGPEVDLQRAIQVDVALLRSAPLTLSLPPLNGGSPRTFAQLHFEDRGDGNVSWSGAPLGVGHETSLFTVHGDGIVGNYELDGKRYSLAAVGGRGFVAETGDPGGDWCHVFGGEDAHRSAHAAQADVPVSVHSNQRTSDPEGGYTDPKMRIDIVFVVTQTAEARMNYLEHGGVGTEATIQALVDWANLVFRNSELATRVYSVGYEEAPSWMMDLEHHPAWGLDWQGPALQAIRSAHQADLAHMLILNHKDLIDWVDHKGVICGLANLYLHGETVADMARKAYGYTNLVCRPDRKLRREGFDAGGVEDLGVWQKVFVHELGHNLGGNHNRQIPHAPAFPDCFEDPGSIMAPGESICARSEYAYGVLINPLLSDNPYKAFESGTWSWETADQGYAPLTEPYPDENNSGAYTVMAYRPGKHWVGLPFFSGGELQEWGVGDYGLKSEDPDAVWVNGAWGEHDNAELFRFTSYDLARLSDHLLHYPRMPKNFMALAHPLGDDGVARVDFQWDDSSDDELHFRVEGVKIEPDGSVDRSVWPHIAIAVGRNVERAYYSWDVEGDEEWVFWVDAVGRDGSTPSDLAGAVIAPGREAVLSAPPAPSMEHFPFDEHGDEDLERGYVVMMQVDGEFFNHDDGGKYAITEIATTVEKRTTGESEWVLVDELTRPPGSSFRAFNFPSFCESRYAPVQPAPDCTHVVIPLEQGWNPRLYDNDYRATAFVTNEIGSSPVSVIEITGPPLPVPPAPEVARFLDSAHDELHVRLDMSPFHGLGGGKYKITSYEYTVYKRTIEIDDGAKTVALGLWEEVRSGGGTPGDSSHDDYPPGCAEGSTIDDFCDALTVNAGVEFDDDYQYGLGFKVTNRVGTSESGENLFEWNRVEGDRDAQ